MVVFLWRVWRIFFSDVFGDEVFCDGLLINLIVMMS